MGDSLLWRRDVVVHGLRPEVGSLSNLPPQPIAPACCAAFARRIEAKSRYFAGRSEERAGNLLWREARKYQDHRGNLMLLSNPRAGITTSNPRASCYCPMWFPKKSCFDVSVKPSRKGFVDQSARIRPPPQPCNSPNELILARSASRHKYFVNGRLCP